MSAERPCPECGEILAPFVRACACGWRESAKPKPAVPSTNCVCGRDGIIKRNGVWICAVCAGYQPRPSGGENFRERWYREHGLPYEPPFLGNVGTFRCVGLAAKSVERAMREPGEDSVDDIGHERGAA